MMPNHIRTAALIALLSCVQACTKSLEPLGGAGAELNAALPRQTRTALGNPSEGVYPLYWSPGDVLSINGESSGAAKIAESGTEARFSLPEGAAAPYRVVYPYREGCEGAYFAIEQAYVEGTFDNGAAPMCAYAEDLQERLTMTPLAGAVRISLYDSEAGGVTVRSLKLSSGSACLAGPFSIDYSSSSVTPSTGAVNSISCVLPTGGIKLSSARRTDFFITLPKGDRGTVRVNIVAAGGAVMTASFDASGEKAVKAGVVREFVPVKFNKNGQFELLDFTAQADSLGSAQDQYLD